MPDDHDVQEILDIGGDAVLERLAAMADHGMVLDITLFAGGQVVSGTLIGRDRWLQQFVERAARGGGGGRQVGEDVQRLFRAVDRQRTAGEPVHHDFLHLAGAQIDGTQRIAEGLLWRGRISEVAGWSLGSL
ncbi:hypothetical protein MO973_35505 [Paenibacillus sp. TRM 82003]|uniref:hypothetical protein n=1 Tax=Kineococcus sp. TRM81007 TaxID=2925831 RepID=UPI001F58DEAB|nr:hypothetical protein [Kineococcus sp. TRM81007]MCI2240167.1 hypothetical protein [Kineococcus sp. TRM81007]MCI3925524.1 hypothetical protein [Paenibacillus sp. TRM 82003]